MMECYQEPSGALWISPHALSRMFALDSAIRSQLGDEVKQQAAT